MMRLRIKEYAFRFWLRALVICIVLGVFWSLAKDRYIRLALPAGIPQAILIVEDRDAEPLTTQLGFLSDRYTVEVPQSGIVRLTSTDVFFRWHVMEAFLPDGTSIPYDYGISTLPDGTPAVSMPGPNSIAVRNCGQIKAGERTAICYYVGTEADAQKHDFKAMLRHESSAQPPR